MINLFYVNIYKDLSVFVLLFFLSVQHPLSSLHLQVLLSVTPLSVSLGIHLIPQTHTGSTTLSSGMDSQCIQSTVTIRSVCINTVFHTVVMFLLIFRIHMAKNCFFVCFIPLYHCLQNYSLSSFIFKGPESFEDNGLFPFTNYSYWLITANVAGETVSAPVSYQTLGAPPATDEVRLNLLGRPGPNTASFNWSTPRTDTGPVER